jgi:hypothetical protein
MSECCRTGFMFDGARHDDDCAGTFGVKNLTDEQLAYVAEHGPELLEALAEQHRGTDRSVG